MLIKDNLVYSIADALATKTLPSDEDITALTALVEEARNAKSAKTDTRAKASPVILSALTTEPQSAKDIYAAKETELNALGVNSSRMVAYILTHELKDTVKVDKSDLFHGYSL